MAELFRPRPDEGYSEAPSETAEDARSDTSMQQDVEMYKRHDMDGVEQPALHDLPNDVLLQIIQKLDTKQQVQLLTSFLTSVPPESQYDLAKTALDILPTSSLASLIDGCYPRLHLDPVRMLPSELIEIVLQHLEPLQVIRCSTMSRRWRAQALDPNRWKALYLREGWRLDTDAIANLLRSETLPSPSRKRDLANAAKASRKRQREDASSSTQAVGTRTDPSQWGEQHGSIEADGDTEMHGLESACSVTPRSSSDGEEINTESGPSSSVLPLNKMNLLQQERHARGAMELEPPLRSELFCPDESGSKLNWLHVFKQRQRLETNWDKGRYSIFQLPKPNHMNEAHDECVYAIQYSGKYLVSGSRDRTLKIWDLDTQRCLRTLSGQHEQSVLCLQFDEKSDMIVSGGSDSYVVIWKFSTGEVIKRMTTAHSESVLNLRFDDRYLITCSKDKTIKIWNRHSIMSDDPIVPHTPRLASSLFPNGEPRRLAPFELIGVLDGHGAAVNAIQIYEDTLVSGSGDRTIRMWNIMTGECIKEFQGHSKGIACVQYDGRRIVSGSSDNTVRIFDAATKGEVACLHGHTNLVRTVQARFGDRSVTDEELEALARDKQEEWARQLDRIGYRPVDTSSARYGLDAITDVRALNTKIPQGGGGSRWARIVSGSYDETVIIWKKDASGKWVVRRRLHQDEILPQRTHVARPRGVPPAARHAQNVAIHPAFLQAAAQHAVAVPPAGTAIAGQQPPAQAGPAAQTSIQQPAQPPQQQPQLPPPQQPAPQQPANPTAGQVQQQQQQQQQRGARPARRAQHVQPAPLPHQANQNHNHTHAAAHHGGHHGARPRHERGADDESNSNRVFKLQFDCRRIVCCSQNRLIVGWDFANGDEDIVRACELFAETD